MEDTEVIDEQIDYELIDEENFENSLDDEEEDDVFKYKKERSTSTKETTIYIDPEELWDEVRKYYELAEANPNDYPSISNKLANALNDIATKIGYRPNFINYSYRVEMIGDAKLKLFKSIRDKSIKLFSTVKIENKKIEDDKLTVYYLDKKGKMKERVVENNDHIEYRNGDEYITFKNPIFGYMTKIAWHCYLNRIKKEKQVDETKRKYQEEVWERFLTSESGKGVRRPKLLDQDENEVFYSED